MGNMRHVMDGRKVLTTRLGQRFWALRWPMHLFFAVLCVNLIASTVYLAISGYGIVEEPVEFATATRVSHFNFPLLTICDIMLCAAIVIILHQAHKALIWLTLMSLDPYIILASVLRMWTCWFFSRKSLDTTPKTVIGDVMALLALLQIVTIFVVIEGAASERALKFRISLFLTALALLLWSMGLQNTKDWSAAQDGTTWTHFSPRNQFSNAALVFAVVTGKGAFNLGRGQDFMFIQSNLKFKHDEILEAFKLIDKFGCDVFDFEEWRAILNQYGIVGSVQRESFGLFELNKDGEVTLPAFRAVFKAQFEKHPLWTFKHHIVFFCKCAVRRRFDIEPLPDMLKIVLEQWDSIQYDAFGKEFCARLAENPGIRAQFKKRSFEIHAVVFVGIFSMVIGWLREARFASLARKLEALGEAHIDMGITVSMMATFQWALLSTLQSQVKNGSCARSAWAFVWMHFVVPPFIRGLMSRSCLTHESCIAITRSAFDVLSRDPAFWKHIEGDLGTNQDEDFPSRHPRQAGVDSWRSINTRSSDPYFAEFLKDVFTHLPLRPDGSEESSSNAAQEEVSFWLRHSRVRSTELVVLFDVFVSALNNMPDIDERVREAFVYVFNTDVLESSLMVPFAAAEIELEDLIRNVRQQPVVSLADFSKCFAALDLSEDNLVTLYEVLMRDDIADWNAFRGMVMNYVMADPCGTLKDALVVLCRAEATCQSANRS